jgi:hypothetical protein
MYGARVIDQYQNLWILLAHWFNFLCVGLKKT